MRGLEALPLLALEEEKTVIERFAKVRRARNSAISDEVTLLFFEIRQIFEGFELCTTILPYLDILADLAKDVLSGNRALSGVDVDESLSSVQNELRVLPLPSRVGEMLSALLRSVAQMFSDEFSHHSRGKGWMMASAVFVELYVPETFFDPAAEAAVLFKSKLRQSECLFSDFLAAKHYTASVLGCQSSLPLVRERLLALTADCKQIELQTAYRPQRSQLGEVMRDLSHLKSMICAREGERTIVELDNIPSEQVDFLQDALQSFIDRTWKKFPAYQDLLLPALGAAFHMKYGLALTSQREGLSLQFEKILEDLLTFFDAGTEHFERHILLLDSIMLKDGISEFSVLVGKTALALLSRLAWKAKVSGLPSQRLNSLFHSIADLLYKWWSAWTENVRKDEEDQATLYKYKERKFDVSSETEIEEAELTETFPSYREEIENDEALKVEKDSRLSPKEFAETLPQEVAEMHLLFVKAMHGREPCTEEAIWYSTAWKAFKTAALVSSHVEHSLSTELDWKSSQSIEFMARTCFAQFDKSAYAVFDIYKDPNTGEVAALLSILEQTQEIAMLILSQFPEHSVARDIASLCSRIASFPTSAPMMKYLTAAELLLLKCNEWERYASRELSMKSCISQLTGLSVKWRGIELQSWSVLLRIEEQKFASKSNALWFNLWSTLGSVAQSDSKESEKEVISVLDQFVLGSAMGEFDYRLSILLTFYNDPYLQSISNGPKIRSILYNIHSYYSQFLPQVKEHILQRKGPIQKELIEFTKIASWKDINVLALKESARRSHYQLAKFMRKYREILSGPVSTVILTIRQTLPESALTGAKTKEYASLTALAGSILEQRPVQSVQRYNSEQRGKRLKSIGVLLMKSHDFLKTAILGNCHILSMSCNICTDNACCNEAINIDDFAQAIIERCESFQKAEDVKGAKSIRRRAFTDLFKFLEYLGVSTRSSPLHESVRDYTFLMGHSGGFASLEGVPLFAQDSLNSATILLVERAEFQYFKLLSRISLTRELAMKSSRDLTERDVERCISSIDYLMVTIIGLRDVLSLVSQSLVDPIFQEYDHLCSSVEADQIVRDLTLAPSGAILSTLTSQKEWVDRTIGVITQIRVFLRELGMSDMLTRDINVLHGRCCYLQKLDRWIFQAGRKRVAIECSHGF
ncbi:hypothetical protein DFJ73DRAFT_164284 [Zopfochytrium polystomum]|nr:hypothetical protein DFJ73DRAFT_164284 [Zopfochytrium polystomum]